MASSWPEINGADADKRRELKISGQILSDRLKGENPTIPPSLFARLKSLNFVELSESPLLVAIPTELGNLTSLTNLILQGNRLEKLPDTLGELKKLKFLDVSRNLLVELPSTIGRCAELQTLNAAHNQLKELPANLIECDRLAHFDGSHNLFELFPSSLIGKKLQHLAEISLKSNQITNIPIEISELTALKNFDMSENKILVVPGELGDCSKLKDLQLRGNDLNDRRLKKLIEDGIQKAILDYVKKHCVKTVVKKTTAKSKASKSGKEKSSDGGNKDEEQENEDDEVGEKAIVQAKDKIVVTPSRAEVKIIWRKDVNEIRPHVLFCVLKNLDFNEPKTLQEFLALQTKLHENQCNRRVAATIATHDLAKIRFPLTYTAQVPESILIHPLGRPKECTAAELVSKLNAEADQLRKEKKRQVYSGVHQYLYLVKDKPKYSCLVDADNRVISLPPITNSDLTKISTPTKNLLLEITSDKDAATCKRVMEALLKGVFASSLIQFTDHPDGAKSKSMSVEQVKVDSEDDTLKVAYPSKIDLTDFGENIEIVRDWGKVEEGSSGQ